MSTSVQKLIPKNFNHYINNETIFGILEFLNESYNNKNKTNKIEIKYTKYDKIVFEDCGQNFESVGCNICGSTINIDWWGEQMSLWNDSGNINVQTICCERITSLNSLIYSMDCGFTDFVIKIYDLGEDVDVGQINKIFGIEVKLIKALY